MMKKHLANLLTSCRILGSIFLLFIPVFTAGYYTVYLLCGVSDMIDGTVARKTGSVSKSGSKLDTAADLAFIAASLITLLPALPIPVWLWVWGGIIAAIKLSNMVLGYRSAKQFLSLHTPLNKITGFLLFLLPLTLWFIPLTYSSVVVCSLATLSAMHEGYSVLKFMPRP